MERSLVNFDLGYNSQNCFEQSNICIVFSVKYISRADVDTEIEESLKRDKKGVKKLNCEIRCSNEVSDSRNCREQPCNVKGPDV